MNQHQRRVNEVARRSAEISVLVTSPWVRHQEELIELIRGEEDASEETGDATKQSAEQ